MGRERKKTKIYWLPINSWNLSEVFTTESISPLSFYKTRNFGNPISRNEQNIEDENNLVLFDRIVENDILLGIYAELLEPAFLSEINLIKRDKLRSFKYSKTVYFKKGSIRVLFCSKEKQTIFLNSAKMLLEVKAIDKYFHDFEVNEEISSTENKAFYQTQLISHRNEIDPHLDKAYNQVKGMIYGYFIGSLGSLETKKQGLLNILSNIKNEVGSTHTKLVLSDEYNSLWLQNLLKKIENCSESYSAIFGQQTDLFETLRLRLKEVDNLNRRRCNSLMEQQSESYIQKFQQVQELLEKAKKELYQFEKKKGLNVLIEDLDQIKEEEKQRGQIKGKTREYFKKGTGEYIEKQSLKEQIQNIKRNPEYKNLKFKISELEENLREYQFGSTQFDNSINEQFNRVTDTLYDITKKTTNYFLTENSASDDFPDISFNIDLNKLAQIYSENRNRNRIIPIFLPRSLTEELSNSDIAVIRSSLNAILLHPEGELGSFSEQNILNIIKTIGEDLKEGKEKQTLRNYYRLRVGKEDNFIFPNNNALANLLVFLMRTNGHEQINKLLISKEIKYKKLAFMFYGAYIGFANMPKTFTNIIFQSNNCQLFNYIERQLNTFLNESNFNIKYENTSI